MPADDLLAAIKDFQATEATIREGGGPKGVERQHRHGRLTARERIDRLVDPGGASRSRSPYQPFRAIK